MCISDPIIIYCFSNPQSKVAQLPEIIYIESKYSHTPHNNEPYSAVCTVFICQIENAAAQPIMDNHC